MVITNVSELYLDPVTGARISMVLHKINADQHSFMLVKDGEKEQVVVAVPKGSHANEQKLKLTSSKATKLKGNKPLFYTQIQDSSVSGY